MFLAEITVFTLASIGCAVSSSSAVLITARAVQGVGGAAMLALTLSIITETFPTESRAGAIGTWAAIGRERDMGVPPAAQAFAGVARRADRLLGREVLLESPADGRREQSTPVAEVVIQRGRRDPARAQIARVETSAVPFSATSSRQAWISAGRLELGDFGLQDLVAHGR